MKIYMATLRPNLRLSGENESLLNLFNSLKEKKIDISLITPINNVRLQSINDLSFFRIIRTIFRLRKIAEENVVIQLHLPTAAFGWVADAIKIGKKVKVVVIYESQLVDSPLKTFFLNYKNDFWFYFLRIFNSKFFASLTLNLADKYIVSSHFQKHQLKKVKKIEVIPNITNPLKYKKDINAKRDYGCVDMNVVTYIGHFLHIKGLHVLTRAFREVIKYKKDAILILACSGLGSIKKISPMINGLENNIRLYGKIDVPKLLSVTDILVAPYVYSFGTNIFPSILLEALSVGTPIITSDTPPLNELLGSGRAILLPSQNYKKLGEAILMLLDNPNLRKEMINRQEKFMCNDFNLDNILKRYNAIYNE